MSPRPKNRILAASKWLTAWLAVNGIATAFAALYVLAQNAVNLRVVASETADARANRLWENRPVLAEARRRIPEEEPLVFITRPGAAFRRFIVHYALYPRPFKSVEMTAFPKDSGLERLARERSVDWIVLDGKSGSPEEREEDRVWHSSE